MKAFNDFQKFKQVYSNTRTQVNKLLYTIANDIISPQLSTNKILWRQNGIFNISVVKCLSAPVGVCSPNLLQSGRVLAVAGSGA